ncbi:MAG: hypothetical protein HY067_09225 [Betaproteobacteria bacterium]|nr:hypothetical protein [Betaproteobacteria bacterium]
MTGIGHEFNPVVDPYLAEPYAFWLGARLSVGCALVAFLAMTNAFAQQEVPTLRYDPPPNFYRSAIHPPDDYSSNEVNATVQVYPFRPFNGNIEQMFQKTLLREWIDPRYQETNVAGQPEFGLGSVRGAQVVLTARFAENIAGIPRQHMRMVIVSGGIAAIVDASANNMTTWQRALPALNVLGASLRVEAGAALPSVTEGPGPAGGKIAGLYMGTKPKYVVDLNRPVGYGKHVPALHYYLFSADGRVYRAYDTLTVPGGEVSRFDFDAAQRDDPVNSGRYTVKGNQLYIKMGDQPPEMITTAAPQGNRITIDTVLYIRQ